MTLDIPQHRLQNQHLLEDKLNTPVEVVHWLGAVQSQDYAGAKWAIGQRTKGLTDAAIEQAFARGEILRTHVLRPTWHFVTPEDIRWMLALTAPRIHALMAYTNRQLELDTATFKKSNAALMKTLQGNKQLTRSELGSALQRSRINTNTAQLGNIIIHAELDGVICSGTRRGKQQTYALLDERAPQAKTLERNEALAELTKRYFRSHGPATLQDFVWWSGLTVKDARNGIESAKSLLDAEAIDDQTYWFTNAASARKPSTVAHLLPNYDEYLVGYTDRTSIFDVRHREQLDSRGNILFQYTIAIEGLIVGTWKRTIKKNEAVINVVPFTSLTRDQNKALIAATQQYGKFLELPVVLNYL